MRRTIHLLWLVVPVLGVAGCKGTTGGGSGAAVKTELAPNAGDYQLETVAVMGFANTSGDTEADDMGHYLVQAFSETGKYRFITHENFGDDARRNGVEEEFNRMTSAWQKKRKVDELILKRLLGATGYDAVLGIEVNQWQEVQLEASQEGTSDTTVGVEVSIYAPDGTLLWWASDLKTEESIQYLPSFNTRATQSGQAVTTSSSSVPEPPPIGKVARDVARDVAATLPEMGRKVETSDSGQQGGSSQ